MKQKIFLTFLLSTFYLLLSTLYCYAEGLHRAEALYLQGSYSESIEECAESISRGKDMDRAYYLLGLNYLKLGDTQKAREKLKIMIENYKESNYSAIVQVLYADSYFIDQEYATAQSRYEEILRTNTALANSAYLGLARCALKTGEWEKAKGYAELLAQKFPKSLEARMAKELFSGQEFFFTVQVGSFASLKNAERLMSKLQGKYFDAFIDQVPSGQNLLYRVRVGKVKTRQEALALKNALEAEGYPTRIFP
ncbi:MAG: hypothetical protein A2Y00_08370 [Omnitrophica WOR_2 bacterium GWF2_43_52]|nr:MAG: hypothetical protein A2Y01_05340 [Omnitrophica WOR_2 bacterium GWC2_44_8]OGX21113.1 MAG: hypothetical protein A2Y00_08370 [Omnitrophica WOR_2 bacterium GWF2_43_52]OGX54734.1 MAG: hypothetical protein A2460_02230 [Omnitrophica WOR_2 bacterium RIFOXYC2_FULL_43_9]HAH19949.1 hypothetical protein [Candidatus Omnitrophota bacterium]HBG62938.1 hypothetical protein [Candidatus Omnitrophota bacterium]